ncbi:O-methyltransferase [Microbispora triticiradicis]|uniref:O-methyltransferase n=1 Tax=Microbispora triticiradicis TaxID=2200763 RepID=UPI001FCCDD42|nr:class I SAM-dependent methyltransferase [Microbispora triticiradicis]
MVNTYLRRFEELRQRLLLPVWPEGRNPDAPWDGTHYVTQGSLRPVSISTCEAFFLANCIIAFRPGLVFEVGTGFGYSAGWLAIGIAISGHNGRLLTLDSYVEGERANSNHRIAKEILDGLGVGHLVNLVRGSSPSAIDQLLDGREQVQVAFIDGDHHGQQPVEDYEALARHMDPRGIIFFHDVDEERYSVPHAVEKAAKDGWDVSYMNTSCRLAAAYRDNMWPALLDRSLDMAKLHKLSLP